MITINDEMIIGYWVWNNPNSEEAKASEQATIEVIQSQKWG